MSLIGSNGQLFGWSEETWLWWDQVGIFGGDIMLLVTLAGAIWALFNLGRIRHWLRRYRFPVANEEAGDGEKWDAIIFTVSRVDLPLWVIEQKNPAAVGLLDSERSRETSGQIGEFALTKGIKQVGPKMLANPDDPAEARDTTAWLISQLRDQGYQRIAVDITGGKTPMSLGAFMAAQEQGCDTLYVTSDFDEKLKNPDTRSLHIRCITRAG